VHRRGPPRGPKWTTHSAAGNRAPEPFLANLRPPGLLDPASQFGPRVHRHRRRTIVENGDRARSLAAGSPPPTSQRSSWASPSPSCARSPSHPRPRHGLRVVRPVRSVHHEVPLPADADSNARVVVVNPSGPHHPTGALPAGSAPTRIASSVAHGAWRQCLEGRLDRHADAVRPRPRRSRRGRRVARRDP
jgi:hypothetical protein